jgi:hypothetical protein
VSPPRSLLALIALALAAPTPAAPPKDEAGWKKLFDGKTLDGWKAAYPGEGGKVAVKDGALLLPRGNRMTGVAYARDDFPKTDYEVTLEGKKVDGDDFFCTTTFPVGDTFCTFVVGGWGGSVVGLSRVDGADAVENDTSKSKEFKKDRWYRVRIRVTPKRIEAWIDDEKLVDLDTTERQLSLRLESRPCRPFGVATWDTVGMVRDVRVRPLTDAEKKAAGGKKE